MIFESADSLIAESRSRTISFRVTTEEFERFRRLCLLKGLRNVSEVIRLAVNQLLDSDSSAVATTEHNVHDRLSLLESRLTYLESRLAPNHIIEPSRLQATNGQ